MENQVQETALKTGAISKGEVTLVAVAGAAPVMCIGGSMHTYLSQTGTGISLAVAFATLLCIFIGLSYGTLSEKYNNAGGSYSYITEIFGKKAGLWTMFVYYGVTLTTSACPPTIFATYLESVTGIPIIVGWIIFTVIVAALILNGIEPVSYTHLNYDQKASLCAKKGAICVISASPFAIRPVLNRILFMRLQVVKILRCV